MDLSIPKINGMESTRRILKEFPDVKVIEAHRAHLMSKLDIHTTAGITLYAVERGIIATHE